MRCPNSIPRSILAALAVVLLLSSIARAQCGAAWLAGSPVCGTNGVVYAMTSWDPDGAGPQAPWLIIAGTFTQVADVPATRIAGWDGQSWHALGSGLNGIVNALTVFNGELIAGGQFTLSGSTPTKAIAHWTGSGWQGYGSGPAGTQVSALALAVYNNQLVAGGWYTSGGFTECLIQRWTGSSWVTLGSGLRSDPGAVVNDLTLLNGELIAAGSFYYSGSTYTPGLSRWNGASWIPFSPGAPINSDNVKCLAVVSGTLYIGRDTGPVHRWTGAGWEQIGSFSGIRRLFAHADNLYVTGGFTNGIKRYLGSADHWETAGDGTVGPANTAGSHNGQLIVNGALGGAPNAVVRLNGAAWESIAPGFDYGPTTFYSDGSRLYMSGSAYNGNFRMSPAGAGRGIVTWDGSAWSLLPSSFNSGAYALTMFQGQLIAGGGFSTIDGQSVNYIASWNGTAWAPMGAGFNGPVRALFIYNGDLIAGGTFTRSGTTNVYGLARWNGSAWTRIGTTLVATLNNFGVFAIAAYNGELVVGGSIMTNGTNNRSVFAWNGSAWHTLGANSFSGDVYSLVNFGSELLVGGSLSDSVSTSGLVRWNGTTWLGTGNGVSNGPVYALVPFADRVAVVGAFTIAGTASAARVAFWNGTTWSTLGTGLDSAAYGAVKFHDELIVGGGFSTAGGAGCGGFARYTLTGAPWCSQQPASTSVMCPGTATFSTHEAPGFAPVTFRWQVRDPMATWADLADGPFSVAGRPAGTAMGSGTRTLSVGVAGVSSLDFRAVVANTCGSAAGTPATVSICIADTDDGTGAGRCGGGVTIEDLMYFLGGFMNGDLATDLDDGSGTGVPDGGLTIDDLLYYLARFAAGC